MSNFKIYKISSKNHTKFYIGSTSMSLNQRLSMHKYNKTHSKFKCSSYDILDDDTIIELLEELPTETTKEDCLKKEGYYIKLHAGSIVNKNIPSRTIKEWYTDNKQRISDNKKTYYINNKANISKKHSEYYLKNREAIIKKVKDYQNKIKNPQ